MIICIDTNVLLQLFGHNQIGRPIRTALLRGEITLAVSNEVLTEYEEIITRLSGKTRWRQIEQFLALLSQLQSNILFIEPQFRFQVITSDPDDNKFVDCAIAAQADYIITEDGDFKALVGAGYKPQPLTVEEFIRKHV